MIASRRLTGAPLPEGKGKSPNITAAGLADWSESDIAYALSTGLTPSGDSLGGPMAAVVRNLAQVPTRISQRSRITSRHSSPARRLKRDRLARRGGVRADAFDHRAHAVRALRGQMLLEPELAERRQRVRLANLFAGSIGKERDGDGDQAAHEMRIAVAAKMQDRLRPGVLPSLSSHTWLTQPRTLLASLCASSLSGSRSWPSSMT